ncbi:hypothetical protein GBAR_LOCUS21513 [Geodia barretti]|uniref:Uncharacterized protein n=1 Tax=Geodia barretti TaxID=519541 RepID=A0AA35WYH1_GEOBA|nr:hypothetical protein GBAR_LOCUS21513 [Geodia barretti]
MKYKLLVAGLAALTVTSFVACGSPAASEPSIPQQPTETRSEPSGAAVQPAATDPAPPPAQAATATEGPSAPTKTATATAAVASTPTDVPATDPPTTAVTTTATQPAATEIPTSPAATNTTEPEPMAAEAPAVDVGTQVGETPPAFAMDRSDGSRIESGEIVGTGRPVFMMYFATW